MSEWQSIETAPKDGSDILVWTEWKQTTTTNVPDFSCAQIARWWDFGAKWECAKIGTPTHWMPLPEPPSTGGQS